MKPTISDHALVRYLERILGMDVEKHRAELAVIVQPFIDCRALHAIHGPFWIVLDGAKVVTVLDAKPSIKAPVRHDRGGRNGTDRNDGPMHWKGRARRRSHK